jgi:hypothetical protein
VRDSASTDLTPVVSALNVAFIQKSDAICAICRKKTLKIDPILAAFGIYHFARAINMTSVKSAR